MVTNSQQFINVIEAVAMLVFVGGFFAVVTIRFRRSKTREEMASHGLELLFATALFLLVVYGLYRLWTGQPLP